MRVGEPESCRLGVNSRNLQPLLVRRCPPPSARSTPWPHERKNIFNRNLPASHFLICSICAQPRCSCGQAWPFPGAQACRHAQVEPLLPIVAPTAVYVAPIAAHVAFTAAYVAFAAAYVAFAAAYVAPAAVSPPATACVAPPAAYASPIAVRVAPTTARVAPIAVCHHLVGRKEVLPRLRAVWSIPSPTLLTAIPPACGLCSLKRAANSCQRAQVGVFRLGFFPLCRVLETAQPSSASLSIPGGDAAWAALASCQAGISVVSAGASGLGSFSWQLHFANVKSTHSEEPEAQGPCNTHHAGSKRHPGAPGSAAQ
ncbi:uncharacterized protein LOC128854424 [Cuculus canorus]|uniref:uncharacterized protein LOC128854424 n=1 Tax=Cuculus canorus TaxID=55661 RepID=UPI0023AAABFB|nr:uncharacterized protein LOC128854424 [Cuculus canorus]